MAAAFLLSGVYFEKYLGGFVPGLVLSAVFLLGLLSFFVLIPDSGFKIVGVRIKSGWGYALGLAFLFFLPVALVDYFFPFPKDMNVPWPQAWWFYPTASYLVEVIFHLLPVAILYRLIADRFGPFTGLRTLWAIFLVIALAEPMVQVGWSYHQDPLWKSTYVFIHIFAFNLVGLGLFKSFDFLTMYAFRFFYYLLWHVLWGAFRLPILY